MHKTNSPVEQEMVTYAVLPDGFADVWIRKNQEKKTVAADGNTAAYEMYEADEVYFVVTADTVSKAEIEADSDFWFNAVTEDGEFADYFALEAYRASKKQELSLACQNTIFAGTDIELSTGIEHFSMKDEDQLNLIGKQAQLATGADKLEYHQDGKHCKYYSAADMAKIIEKAMEFKSFNTTYGNSLNMWLKSCTKASDMSNIVYGCVIPEEYWSDVYRDYMEKMEA